MSVLNVGFSLPLWRFSRKYCTNSLLEWVSCNWTLWHYHQNWRIQGRAPGTLASPLDPIAFIFKQFSEGNCPNNRLAPWPWGMAPPVWEILDPPLVNYLGAKKFLVAISCSLEVESSVIELVWYCCWRLIKALFPYCRRMVGGMSGRKDHSGVGQDLSWWKSDSCVRSNLFGRKNESHLGQNQYDNYQSRWVQ